MFVVNYLENRLNGMNENLTTKFEKMIQIILKAEKDRKVLKLKI